MRRIDRLRRMRAKVDARRAQTNDDAGADPGPLMDFIPRVSPHFRSPTHLHELVDDIERSTREQVEACHSVPVRHAKTTTLKHGVAWWLARDPTESILYASYAHGFAALQVADSRDIAVRAGVRMGRIQRHDEWTTAAGGVVVAVGLGGQITGRGFTKIIVDDAHKNRAEAESRVVRERVVEGFYNDLYTRRDPRGTSIFNVQARWNQNDLYGVLTRGARPFAARNAPALDDQGRALAPWLFDVPALEQIRDTVGPYVWASLYQGQPRPRGGALFVDVTLVEQLPHAVSFRWVIGLDLARTARTRSDHHAAVVMRCTDDGMLDVLEVARARGTITDRTKEGEVVDLGFIRDLARLARKYPGAGFVMYASEGEAWLVEFVEGLLSEALGAPAQIRVRVIESKDKWMRSQRYSAAWNAGRVRIPAPSDPSDREGWQGAFVAEHVEFTGLPGQADDQVDAAVAAHDDLTADQGTSLAEAMKGVRI